MAVPCCATRKTVSLQSLSDNDAPTTVDDDERKQHRPLPISSCTPIVGTHEHNRHFGPLSVDLANVGLYIQPSPSASAVVTATLQVDDSLSVAVTGSAGLAAALQLPSASPCQITVKVRVCVCWDEDRLCA
jgi:hypothetical protein